MNLLDNLYLSDILHTISSDLLIPVVVLLLVFIVYSVYSIGSVLVEVVAERRHYRAYVPELVAQLDAAAPDELEQVIERSGLLRNQKDDLAELTCYLYLPEDARTEVAKRLLANEDMAYQKVLGRTDVAAKVAPMLGLMGTLIPLGPGIVALGTGDTETLSSALLVAFDTTVAGLATAVVCHVISRMRRRWYGDYLVSMEAAFNTLLEKAEALHAEGFAFKRERFAYDKRGRKATRLGVADATAKAKVGLEAEASRAGVSRAGGDAGERGANASNARASRASEGRASEGACALGASEGC